MTGQTLSKWARLASQAVRDQQIKDPLLLEALTLGRFTRGSGSIGYISYTTAAEGKGRPAGGSAGLLGFGGSAGGVADVGRQCD
jgi:hypothetical protein